MRLPSIQRLAREAGRTLVRFPFVLAAAGLAALFALLAVDLEGDVWPRAMLAAALGLPLFVAAALVGERRRWGPGWRAAAGAAGAALLAAFGWLHAGWPEPMAWTRFFHLAVALHLLVAWLPYAGVGEANGFWQYNRSLFLRFLLAALYTSVLWGGLSLALAAVDRLLGIEVAEEAYLRLWIVLAFLFHTWFFLAGVPVDLPALDERADYPAGLKIFAQFVLVPIVAIYLLILTAYMARILVTRTWPSGWIGWLVSGVAALGILSLLLVHPVREREENRWIPAFARLFWIVLFPSIVMLLLAVGKRLGQYGVTERRYFLVVLALWLAGIAIWYTATRSRNIKLIPASLAAVALLVFGGPWGAYAVSERSQTGRLETLFVGHGMLAGGRVRPATDTVPFEDRREMSAILRYLIDGHGTESIASWFGGELASVDTVGRAGSPPRWRAPERAALILEHLGVAYVEEWAARQPERFRYSADPRGEAIRIAGFTHALRVNRMPVDTLLLEGRVVRVELGADSLSLVVRVEGEPPLEVPLREAVERAGGVGEGGARRALPAESLAVSVPSEPGRPEGTAAKFYLTSVAGRRTPAGLRVEGLSGELYLRRE